MSRRWGAEAIEAKALTVIGSDAHGRWTPRLRLELVGA
jgi:hypothetical protein